MIVAKTHIIKIKVQTTSKGMIEMEEISKGTIEMEEISKGTAIIIMGKNSIIKKNITNQTENNDINFSINDIKHIIFKYFILSI